LKKHIIFADVYNAHNEPKNDDKFDNYNLVLTCLIIFVVLTFIFLVTAIIIHIKFVNTNKNESKIY
jgi:hypothetical protein